MLSCRVRKRPTRAIYANLGRADEGEVRHVTHGDTCRLTSGEPIPFAGIDAPETQAPNANYAAERRRGEAAKRRANHAQFLKRAKGEGCEMPQAALR